MTPLKHSIKDEFGNELRGKDRVLVLSRINAKRYYHENKDKVRKYRKSRLGHRRALEKIKMLNPEYRAHVREKSKQQRLKNPAKHRACIKRWEARNIEKVRKCVRESMRRCRAKNRELFRERVRKWRREHPTHRKEFYEKHKDAILKQSRESRIKNPALFREWGRKWKCKNRDKVKAYAHKRRALQNSCTVDETARAFIKFVHSKKRICCYYCGRSVPSAEVHIDHVIAISKKGNHASDNLAASCADCNLRKSDKFPSEIRFINQPLLNL